MSLVTQSIGQVITNHTIVYTGFSTDPVSTCPYSVNGKLCFVSIMRSSNGISNAAATTLTLPFPAANDDEQQIPIWLVSNATIQAGFLVTRMGSNIADVKTAAGADPASSGTKAVQGNFFYRTT